MSEKNQNELTPLLCLLSFFFLKRGGGYFVHIYNYMAIRHRSCFLNDRVLTEITDVNSRGISCIEIHLRVTPAQHRGWYLLSCCLLTGLRMMHHLLHLCFSEPTASVPPHSDVYRMLHDNRDEPTPPRQSGSFRVLQELVNDGSGESLPVSTDVYVEALGWVEEKKNWATGNGCLDTGFSQYSSESLLRS